MIRIKGPDSSGCLRVRVDDRLFGVVIDRGKHVVYDGLRRRYHERRFIARGPNSHERTYPSATMALDALLFDAALWTWKGWD